MLQRLRGLIGKSVRLPNDPKAIQQEIDQVIQELRQFSRDDRSVVGTRKSLEYIAQTEPPDKLFQMANVLYENSTNKDGQRAKAIRLWKAAMEKGHSSSKYSYAECIRRGEGNEVADPKRAIRILQELAEEKHPWGTFALADMLSKGEGSRKNDAKAFELYEQSAELHVPPAFYNVGNMYATGTGVRQDIKQAIRWYEKAVELGDPQAKSTLGDLLCTASAAGGGSASVVVQDLERGFRLRKEAAAYGIPMALYNVGWHYMEGSGVEQDYFKAATYFGRASDKGVAMATVNLGILYRDGRGVKRNPERAKQLFAVVAPHDSYAAQLLQGMQAT